MTGDRSAFPLPAHTIEGMSEITDATRDLYIDLLKRVIANTIYEDPAIPNPVFDRTEFNAWARSTGSDWPSVAHTMVGMARLENVRACLERVIADGVPGDFIETGVWRGGVCILARGVLKAHGVTDRTVWVADSFEGVPTAGDLSHPIDQRLNMHEHNEVLGVDEAAVRRNFERYDLLDDQVRFLPGWFNKTLPTAPIERLAVLRLDGDLYESTLDALNPLYPKLSVGGYVIIDDYLVPGCRAAVDEFRAEHGIDDPIERIDRWSVFWRRSR
ncbi:methyltransferase MtfB [Actinokineospora fastidiosa]|uniref:Methyltransferase MtfB n=2 Tax=Actinokineospora fastidiosa TaxID=1816 RepID=A0A918GSN7_9PSEU|nr:methyltransferase MtfB [Actinokineospora fastidiosa]